MDAMDLIKQHEGERLRVYRDTRGFTSIGIGRNLDGKGISHEEALMLFARDFTDAQNEALKYPWYKELDARRQAVVLDMIFEMGSGGFRKFVRLHEALEAGDYKAAVAAMLNSAWAGEVPRRAHEDAAIMDTGNWPAAGEVY